MPGFETFALKDGNLHLVQLWTPCFPLPLPFFFYHKEREAFHIG